MHEPPTRLRTALALAARLVVLVASGIGTTTAYAEELFEVVVPLGPDTPVRARWEGQIERELARDGQRVTHLTSIDQALSLRRQTIARSDLARLVAVASHLVEARVAAAQLAEGNALAELTAAARLLDSLLHVPGASAFYAEVQTAIGLVAAQAGMTAVADAALRRAAVIDPTRGVRAAETTPAWLARGEAIGREVATGPVGEAQVTSNVVGARVYLDDNLQGTAPTTLRATRGVHVLRIEADGHRALGMLVPVDAGTRPAIHLALDPDPVTMALRSLSQAASSVSLNDVRDMLSALRDLDVPIGSAWLFRTSALRDDRALMIRCTAEGCGPNQRLELDATGSDPEQYGQTLDPAGLGRDRERRDLAWLNLVEPSAVPKTINDDPAPWWQRWYLWTAAAVVVGTATAVGIAASDPPERRLRVTIEP